MDSSVQWAIAFLVIFLFVSFSFSLIKTAFSGIYAKREAKDREGREEKVAAIVEHDGFNETISIGRIFDIGFEVEGESVEPASEVSVHIRLANAEEEAAKVLHITDEGVEVIVPDSAPEGSESVDFTVEQLSPFLMQKRNAKGGEQGIITDFNTEVIQLNG